MFINPIVNNIKQKPNIYSYNKRFTNNKFNNVYSSDSIKDIVSFKGVQDQNADNNIFNKTENKDAKQVVENLFSREDYENLTQDEVKFLISYIQKEDEIRSKYQEKIEEIKDGFWDNWFNISEKKRAAIRNDMNKELDGARTMQALFTAREQETSAFRDEFLTLAKSLNYSKEVISALNADVEATKKRININSRRESFDKDFGLKKLAGYEKEKAVLQSNFIDYVDDEKAGKIPNRDIPNAILFYGPTGCGKTTFAKALAEEADCSFIEMKIRGRKQSDKEDAFIDDIEEKLASAQEKFLKTNKRTIILIDEFDRFFDKKSTSSDFIQYLKGLMNDCSKENHVTLFLNTNDPLKIPEPLRNAHRTGIIVTLDPPDKDNMKAVLKHYLRDANQSNIDYDRIISKLTETYPDEVYSNSHLKKMIDMACTSAEQCGDAVNTDYIMDAINDYNQNDNIDLIRITKEYLDKYNYEKEITGTRYAE